MARLSIRIDFEPSGSALGPGMAELLAHINQLGSISKAAVAMEMSYRKAWLLVQDLQHTFGGAVVTTEIGGAAGGGARLTKLGEQLLDAYRGIEKSAADATRDQVQALAAMVQKDAGPRTKGKSRGKKQMSP